MGIMVDRWEGGEGVLGCGLYGSDCKIGWGALCSGDGFFRV